jgi:Homeodomain-like domain
MTKRADPITEYAALVEVTDALNHWSAAEDHARQLVKARIADGVHAATIAEHLGWSRATLYRWLAVTPLLVRPPLKRKYRSRNRA